MTDLILRRGALALLIGGPMSLVFHALWRIGHGPTVVNEHRVVLGLTNDQWSYLGGVWAALVAIGVVAVCSLHRGRLSLAAGALTLVGLTAGTIAAWVWPLYSIGAVILHAGVLGLAVVILRDRCLPRWSAVALLGALAGFVPVVVAGDMMLARSFAIASFELQGNDITASLGALGWTALGLGLARVTRKYGGEQAAGYATMAA